MDDAISVIERSIRLWNEHDREGLLALIDDSAEIEAPGGIRLSGPGGFAEFYDTWTEAFPDNATDGSTFGEGERVTEEGRFRGTHTGTLRGPGGDAPPTGRSVDAPYAVTYRVRDGRITSIRLYFDQLDLLGQLGLVPEPAAGAPAH